MSKIKGGYYIKARCIQESEIAHAPPHFREIWDWLLKECNHADQKYGKHTIKRGQCFRSYKDIRDGLAWKVGYRKERYSENQTKKAMKFLRENRMIETRKELGGVLITICNYERYQNPKNYERTGERTDERTNGEPMGNQGGPDNNKKGKNEKNEISIPADFSVFWKAYPKKKSKGQAEVTWDKINPSRELLDRMLDAIEIAKQSEDWTKEKGSYIPYPSTWLNAKGWEDEYENKTEEKTKNGRFDFLKRD